MKELQEKGIFSEKRLNFLKNPGFESHDLIFHEAGIPPIHTSVDVLASLSTEIKSKLRLYHIAEKDMIKAS